MTEDGPIYDVAVPFLRRIVKICRPARSEGNCGTCVFLIPSDGWPRMTRCKVRPSVAGLTMTSPGCFWHQPKESES